MIASTYIPTRVEILAARGLKTVLVRQGKHVPADIERDAEWDLEDALDTVREVQRPA